MTKEQAIEKLDKLSTLDIESRHLIADGILCDLLIELGYQEVVDSFDKLVKYYA